MKNEKAIMQLSDLISDRESFLSGNSEDDVIYEADIEALKTAIKALEKKSDSTFGKMCCVLCGLVVGATFMFMVSVVAKIITGLI